MSNTGVMDWARVAPGVYRTKDRHRIYVAERNYAGRGWTLTTYFDSPSVLGAIRETSYDCVSLKDAKATAHDHHRLY